MSLVPFQQMLADEEGRNEVIEVARQKIQMFRKFAKRR